MTGWWYTYPSGKSWSSSMGSGLSHIWNGKLKNDWNMLKPPTSYTLMIIDEPWDFEIRIQTTPAAMAMVPPRWSLIRLKFYPDPPRWKDLKPSYLALIFLSNPKMFEYLIHRVPHGPTKKNDALSAYVPLKWLFHAQTKPSPQVPFFLWSDHLGHGFHPGIKKPRWHWF